MAHKENNKPKYELKEGNMKVQVFINKNAKGVKYAIYKIWRYRFPFKFNGSIDLYATEIEKLKIVLNNMPKIEIEQKVKKKSKKE